MMRSHVTYSLFFFLLLSCSSAVAKWGKKPTDWDINRSLRSLPVQTSFAVMNMYDSPAASLNPPSVCGAVGTSQVIGAGVMGVVSLTRSGQKDYQLDTSLDAMFNNVDAANPQIRFDSHSKRWFFMATSVNNDTFTGCPGHIFIAVSSTDIITPTTTWRVVDLAQEDIAPAGNPGAGILDATNDFASLGIDSHALYIGLNLFDCDTETFISGTVYVIQKSSLINGDPVVATAFRGLSTDSNIFAPVGVDNFDANSEFGYVIGKNNSNETQLVLYRIINPGSTTPTISAPVFIDVAQTAQPVPAPYKNLYGAIVPINTLDNRLHASHIRDGQLFTVRHIGVDQNGLSAGGEDRDGVRWTQLDLAAGGTETATTVPDVVAEGTLYDDGTLSDDTVSYYFPSIMTNANGVMALAGSFSSLNSFASGFAANRLVASAVDNAALRASVQNIAPGVALYSVDGPFTAIESWGIYSKIALDPVDQTTMWPFVEFVQNYDCWGINAAALEA